MGVKFPPERVGREGDILGRPNKYLFVNLTKVKVYANQLSHNWGVVNEVCEIA